MANIYDQTVANAASIILKTSDRELSSEGYKERVFNSAKISVPKLHLDQTKVDIKQEEISYRNAPIGISFSTSGSRIIEYDIYSIPVGGDMELFAFKKYFLSIYFYLKFMYISVLQKPGVKE